jgi:putative tRNA adenosine deaminase-associated protein
MTTDATLDDDALDFALVAWDESGSWQLTQVPPTAVLSLDAFINAVRMRMTERGALGMISIDEDFFIIVRTIGDYSQMFISDASAAHDWNLAREILNRLDVPLPEGDGVDDILPAGDMSLLGDLGFSAQHLEELCSAVDLYPDEMLATIARRIGFSDQFDAILEELP